MIISGYGIRLHRLKNEEDIELLRKWRNSSRIHQFMEFRNQISKKQQTTWFQSIDNIHNNYMLIEYEGKKIGMIHGAGIDWDKKSTASGGIFIWDESYWMTKVPTSAAILMTDMSTLLGLEKTFIKILKTNKNAILFNKSLGYEILTKEEETGGLHYVLDQTKYLVKRKKIIKNLLPEYCPVQLNIEFNANNNIDLFYYQNIDTKPQIANLEITLIEQKE
ncbi:MAG: GNAT family N-acetyltransferase [Flavobacteriaceae bacterium]|nr:GNAT family N-acetyltransferase [Flavobacteriaceae bacterium]